MKKFIILVIGFVNLCCLSSFGSIGSIFNDDEEKTPSLKVMAIKSIQNHIQKLKEKDIKEAFEYAQKISDSSELFEDLKELIFLSATITNNSNLDSKSRRPVISYFARKVILDLDFTKIKSISFFDILYQSKFLTKLAIDEISDENKIHIEQFIDFSGLKNLKSLTLQYFYLNDINFLEDIANLTTLNISLGKIENISGLKYLTNLDTLILNEIDLDDVTPISSLSKLRCLSLNGNDIRDLTPLSSLKKLQMVILSSNGIKDLTPLSSLQELQRLNLGNNFIKDLTPLKSLKNLNLLLLYGNKIKNIESVNKLKKLRILDLRYNPLDLNTLEPQLVEKLASIKELKIFVKSEIKIKNLNLIPTIKELSHIITDFRAMEFRSPFSTINFKL